MNENFGTCKECKKKNTSLKWCQSCNAKRLESEFPNWTSGNNELDEFLKKTQLTARCWQEVFEWIPCSNIIEMEYIGKGGYGTVYKSKWLDGCIIKWMHKEKMWKRWGTEYVALKTLDEGFSHLMHELKALHRFIKFNSNGFECYGVTQDPDTHKYMIVTDYYKGDLRNIHSANLVHRDFHSGNVLVDGITCISDLGLSRDIETLRLSADVNGVMPYVAPEVLRRNPYTKAADVYSFGIIMWEFTSYQLPFSERPHDINLAIEICDGLRPLPVKGTPPCYIELMQQCWDSNPEKRPTADQIANILQTWFDCSDEYIHLQFKTSDEVMQERPLPNSYIHPSAVFTSRRLPTVSTFPTIPIDGNYQTRQFDLALPDEGDRY
ncbi:kinase-like domain-containing protein [Gigaspora rosea]|uniref:Kinase-like domain-containing protein n=1 Tax=Gigaspora rosea TaxID=44941 RepID=A0A397VP14_9GLOM|nr:kinase-like domain-containing protein [Gigaspora rosea]